MKNYTLSFAIILSNIAVAGNLDVKVDELLSKMTVQEKVGQLIQLAVGRGIEKDPAAAEREKRGEVSSYIWFDRDPALRNRRQRNAVEGSRLGIPILFANDIIHGCDLTFPISPFLAGAFEPELFERVQSVAAAEASAEGVDWVFAPMCDVARDQRWGRVEETCGEDPYLASLCVAAQVRGFQGKDPSAPDRVAACMKHFVGYSRSEGGRDYNIAPMGEWELQNVHLPTFRAAAQNGVKTTMSSFNDIDGIPACAAKHTLTDILRGEWGFGGFVVSDWDAVSESIVWGYASDRADAAKKALEAGGDMDMLGGSYPALVKSVESGKVDMKTLDQAVRRVLKMKFEIGLFDHPYVDETRLSKVVDENSPTRKAARKLARECVSRSTVLLKNSDILPISSEATVALVGPFADDAAEMLGAWRGRGHPETVVTLKAALMRELGDRMVYVKGCPMISEKRTRTLQDGSTVEEVDDKSSSSIVEAKAAAVKADVVILCVGEPSGWTGENASRASLGLTGAQNELFDAVVSSGKPVVTLVFSGRMLALPEIWNRSAAVMYCGQPGSEAGNGLADLIFGRESPSARLTMSVPWDANRLPLYYNSPITGRPQYGKYRDKPEDRQLAAYPFGYGLTYTTFKYSETKREGDRVVCEIENTGNRAGVETAQLYIHQVACAEGVRPTRELRGFKRISLAPGERKKVIFTLDRKTLGYVDRSGNDRCDYGKYKAVIAQDSASGEMIDYDLLEVEKGTWGQAVGEVKVSNGRSVTDKPPMDAKYRNPKLPIEERIEDLMGYLTDIEKIQLMHATGGNTAGDMPRIGLKPFRMIDGPGGPRDCDTVYFPEPISWAASRDTNLVYRIGRALAEESRGMYKETPITTMLLGPGINLARTPTGARNFEYMGEDPVLSGKIAAADILGMQSRKVSPSVKHFICNDQEAYRTVLDVICAERPFRELYGRAFEVCVKESHPWCIMNSYNGVNGRYTSQAAAENDALREWGFDGMLISDWGGAHGAVRAFNAGTTIESCTSPNEKRDHKELELMNAGILDRNRVEAAVRANLRTYFRMGLFDSDTEEIKALDAECVRLYKCAEHRELAKTAAIEGTVLLENKGGFLPLKRANVKTIAVTGPYATTQFSRLKHKRKAPDSPGGEGVCADEELGFLDGLKAYFGAENVIYNPLDEVDAASKADVVIFCTGTDHWYDREVNGWGIIHPNDRPDLKIKGEGVESRLKAVAKANPNTIVAMIHGGPIDVSGWVDDVKAVLAMWYPGIDAGGCLARMIFGDDEPGGRLPYTFADNLSDWPCHRMGEKVYPGVLLEKKGDFEAREWYDDGIWVGYRGFDHYGIKPRYPFGYGLGYTTFELKRIGGNERAVEFEVKNTGSRKGKAVVECYVEKLPADGTEVPVKELVDFAVFRPEAGKTVKGSFALGSDAFRYWKEGHGWVECPGKLILQIH